jgi:ferrous iron transport protein B
MSNCQGCAGAGTQAGVKVLEFAGRGPNGVSSPLMRVAVIGPPNSGKTTLFNRITGLRQKVANFPGVTVEQHTGLAVLPDGRETWIIDLPGVYSLNWPLPFSPSAFPR